MECPGLVLEMSVVCLPGDGEGTEEPVVSIGAQELEGRGPWVKLVREFLYDRLDVVLAELEKPCHVGLVLLEFP